MDLAGGRQAAGRRSRRSRPAGVVQLRAREIRRRWSPPATSTLPLGSNVAVWLQRAVARLPVARPGVRPPGRTVPRSRDGAAAASPCDEHLAVGQQRRRVNDRVRSPRLPVARPGPAGRIVQFRARERADVAVVPAGDEHLAVGQQRRRVERACGGRGCRSRCPGPARRIVQFRARERGCRRTRRRRAPCRWAATSPCADSACGGEAAGALSRSRSPDRTVPRSRDRLPS